MGEISRDRRGRLACCKQPAAPTLTMIAKGAGVASRAIEMPQGASNVASVPAPSEKPDILATPAIVDTLPEARSTRRIRFSAWSVCKTGTPGDTSGGTIEKPVSTHDQNSPTAEVGNASRSTERCKGPGAVAMPNKWRASGDRRDDPRGMRAITRQGEREQADEGRTSRLHHGQAASKKLAKMKELGAHLSRIALPAPLCWARWRNGGFLASKFVRNNNTNNTKHKH